MGKNTITIVVIVGVIILSGWFYWYEWRPSQISKSCYVEAEENAQVAFKEMAETSAWKSVKDRAEKGYFNTAQLDNYYKNCMRVHGIYK